MRIKISKHITADHCEIEEIIRLAMKGVNTTGVEVHVKGKVPDVRYIVDCGCNSFGHQFSKQRMAKRHAEIAGGTVTREVHVSSNFTGRAYNGIPDIANVAKGVKYLVTIAMPRTPTNYGYPKIWRYPGRKNSPVIPVRDWQAELFHTAAHEAYHVKQYRTGMSVSENKADRWALKRMLEEGIVVDEPRSYSDIAV